ncbi:MAG: rod shape-determining protein RodA [Pseudomonadota bacterium]|jgi:rod shape determining protein RodA
MNNRHNIFKETFNLLFGGFDIPLILIILSLFVVSTFTIYSASIGSPVDMWQHFRNVGLAIFIIWLIAQIPPNVIMQFAIPIYTVGISLLVGVMLFGLVKKGAQRWLNIGITVIQPSEILKIAVPLMLAWYYHKREQSINTLDYIVGLIIVAIPFVLIAKQPDLGTAVLVLAAGFYVIFLAGFSWKIIIPLLIIGITGISLIVSFEHTLCLPEQSWQPLLHDYQKHRICTLLDPSSDPLGKGFHILQSMIAIGSGGVVGKGWLNGTQSRLEFIPEKHTDFIFAVYSEEFGLIGNIILMFIYTLLIFRSLFIASNANILFSKLIAGAISLMFFTYVFVNVGMVSGILPVVGVPLPFMSYGGTAFATLGMCIGILMSIARHKPNMRYRY